MQKNNSDFIGVMPIPKLLLKFSVPAIISTTVNCLYNTSIGEEVSFQFIKFYNVVRIFHL